MRIPGARITFGLMLLTGAGASVPIAAQTVPDLPFSVETIGTFDLPWAMAFLPDGKMLVTQKMGAMILFDPKSGAKIALSGIPTVVSRGRGALMDVMPFRDFKKSKRIYFSFSEAGDGKMSHVALATARVDEAAGALRDVNVFLRGDLDSENIGHYSGRFAYSPDGKYLFVTSGERQMFDPAQDPRSIGGKMLRLNLDGTPARGNPLAAKGFHPAVWSYGHRNPYGIAFDKGGRLWEVEFGPRGGDEINLIKPGLNYGWPRVSNGNHYDGRDIPDHAPGDGFEPPKIFWNPVISPGGMAYYNAKLFPAWKNSLLVAGLSGKCLERIALDGEKARKADHWDMGQRIRSVRTGPDGAVWLMEDSVNGRMLRLTPKR